MHRPAEEYPDMELSDMPADNRAPARGIIGAHIWFDRQPVRTIVRQRIGGVLTYPTGRDILVLVRFVYKCTKGGGSNYFFPKNKTKGRLCERKP